MDKSDTPHYKSLCYNCLFKLQIGDIEKKICPSCRMPINKDGLPLKNSSNSTWKKSDTGDSKIDEEINKEVAQDQGFHFGKITRLRYGITEGNYGNWIINPDKSFDYQYKYDKLLINRYRLTKSATTLKKTSSLNIVRNGLKEMLINSKYTPSILYIELKKAKPNYPTHIILLEEKFLNARFGKSTGINLLLNLIHTNNFFPVTSSLHRKTIIYKVSKNYEQSISTSYLMPSSGLTVIERIPHNHLSLFDDETQLKKDIEDSLKFVNIKTIHQYIPTLINKKNMIFGAEIKKDLGIIEDDDDKMSQLSDLSVTSEGEVISRTTSSIVKPKPKSGLLHMGIPDETEAKSDTSHSIKTSTILPLKINKIKKTDKSNLHKDKSSKTNEEKSADARRAVSEHMGIFDTSSDITTKTTRPEKQHAVSMSDLEDVTQESIGIDFLGDNTTQESEEIISESQDESDQFRIGIDFLGERNSKIRHDEDKSKDNDQDEEENQDIKEDKVKSHKKTKITSKKKPRVNLFSQTDNQSNNDTDEKEHDESDSKIKISFGSDISTDDTDQDTHGRIGIDFLGEKRQITENNRKVAVDFNDSGDDHVEDDVKVTFKKYTVKNTDSDDEDNTKVESDTTSEKNTLSMVNDVDLPDYASPLHNFWGDFNKRKISVRNSAKKYSKKEIIMYETDEESDITVDNDSDLEEISDEDTEEKKPKKNTKPRRSPKKTTEEKKPKKNTKPKRSPKKTTGEKKPKKNTKPRRSPKKTAEDKKHEKNTSAKKRDNKGRYISSSKRVSSNKRKSKSKSSGKSSKKKRDTKGRYVSPKTKSKKNDSRSRDSKGRYKPVH